MYRYLLCMIKKSVKYWHTDFLYLGDTEDNNQPRSALSSSTPVSFTPTIPYVPVVARLSDKERSVKLCRDDKIHETFFLPD